MHFRTISVTVMRLDNGEPVLAWSIRSASCAADSSPKLRVNVYALAALVRWRLIYFLTGGMGRAVGSGAGWIFSVW